MPDFSDSTPSTSEERAAAEERSGWGNGPAPAFGVPWRRALFIGLLCFAIWTLLDAPSLLHSAEVSPLGARRSAAITVLRPIAAVSDALGLSGVVSTADSIIGRSSGGGPSLAQAKAPLPKKDPRPHHPVTTKPGTPPASSTTTTTFPALPTAPTATDPLRVLSIGDSIGIDLGRPLVDDLTGTGVVKATLDAKVDTGLSRPDYFNWPKELQIDLANDSPQLVVVMMGANDPQSMLVGGQAVPYGTPQWNTEYGKRVGSLLDEAGAAGAHVLWVGMPPMARPQLNTAVQNLNGIVKAQIAARPGWTTYLSSWTVLGTPQGGFTAYLPGPSGSEINVRTPDGVHLSPGGGRVLANAVIAAMRSRLHIDLPG